MLVDSFHDTGVFLASFMCGQLIGLVLDVFRGYRKNKKVSKNILAAQDSLFCAIAFYLFYKTVCLTNFGDIRWYTVLGAFFGTVLYFVAESIYIIRITTGIWKAFFSVAEGVKKVFRKVFGLPGRLFSALKKKFLNGIYRDGSRFRQFFIKNPFKKLKKDM